MRDVEAHALHALDHRRRRRRRGDQRAHLVVDALAQFRGRVDEHRMHDRRAAVVAHLVLADGVEDRLRLDAAQAHVGACQRGDGPCEAPAVAMEHRQRPEIDGVARHAPVDDVRQRVEIRAAMMIDHALGIAGGAGRVVERDRVPFVGGVGPFEIGIAAGDEALVIDRSQARAAWRHRVVDVDHQRRLVEQSERGSDDRREFGVGDENLRLAVTQHEGDGLGVEPGVERVEHAAAHRHAEMRLDHLRRVRRHQRDRVAGAHSRLLQRRGEAARARVGLGPGVATRAVHHRKVLGIRVGRARDQRHRRQRRVIRRVALQVLLVGLALRHRKASLSDAEQMVRNPSGKTIAAKLSSFGDGNLAAA